MTVALRSLFELAINLGRVFVIESLVLVVVRPVSAVIPFGKPGWAGIKQRRPFRAVDTVDQIVR